MAGPLVFIPLLIAKAFGSAAAFDMTIEKMIPFFERFADKDPTGAAKLFVKYYSSNKDITVGINVKDDIKFNDVMKVIQDSDTKVRLFTPDEFRDTYPESEENKPFDFAIEGLPKNVINATNLVHNHIKSQCYLREDAGHTVTGRLFSELRKKRGLRRNR